MTPTDSTNTGDEPQDRTDAGRPAVEFEKAPVPDEQDAVVVTPGSGHHLRENPDATFGDGFDDERLNPGHQ
jgi:hypothetical protein